MIKVLNFSFDTDSHIALVFSDHSRGTFDLATYLASRSGPLLEPLKDPAFRRRAFIDAGALCWPNGLEISPARLHELSSLHAAA